MAEHYDAMVKKVQKTDEIQEKVHSLFRSGLLMEAADGSIKVGPAQQTEGTNEGNAASSEMIQVSEA